MRIWTLWEHDGDDSIMPWLIDSYDEYTLEECGEVPESYQKLVDENIGTKRKRRELVVHIPEDMVKAIFGTIEITAEADSNTNSL